MKNLSIFYYIYRSNNINIIYYKNDDKIYFKPDIDELKMTNNEKLLLLISYQPLLSKYLDNKILYPDLKNETKQFNNSKCITFFQQFYIKLYSIISYLSSFVSNSKLYQNICNELNNNDKYTEYISKYDTWKYNMKLKTILSSLIFDTILGNLLLFILLYHYNDIVNIIKIISPHILSILIKFNELIKDGVLLLPKRIHNPFFRILDIIIDFHIFYYQILLSLIPILKILLCFPLLISMSLFLKLLSLFIPFIVPSIYLLRYISIILYKCYCSKLYTFWLISRGKIYNNKQKRVESWNYRPIQKYIGIYYFCMMLLSYPLSFAVYVMNMILYYIFHLTNSMLKIIGNNILLLPIYEIFSYIIYKFKLFNDVYYENEEDKLMCKIKYVGIMKYLKYYYNNKKLIIN